MEVTTHFWEAIFRICWSNTVKSSAHYLADLWTWFLYFFNLFSWLRRLFTARDLLNKFQYKVPPPAPRRGGDQAPGQHRDHGQGVGGECLDGDHYKANYRDNKSHLKFIFPLIFCNFAVVYWIYFLHLTWAEDWIWLKKKTLFVEEYLQIYLLLRSCLESP